MQPWFSSHSKTGSLERRHVRSNWFLGWTSLSLYLFQGLNMMILFPRITTFLYCSVLLPTDCRLNAFIYHKFHKAIKSPNIPWTCLPPFNFSYNFLSLNFPAWQGELCSWHYLTSSKMPWNRIHGLPHAPVAATVIFWSKSQTSYYFIGIHFSKYLQQIRTFS